MPRKVLSYVSLVLSLCAVIILNVECMSGIPDRCLELIKFDVHEIENHLSELNLTDVPTVKMMTAGFKCPISALPFGTLKSDWARLLLLHEAQPDGSIIKLKLVGLMRILIIAYYQMEERILVVTDPGAKPAKKSLIEETRTTVSAADETGQPHCPNSSYISVGAEILSNNNNANRHCSCTDSFPNDVTRLATKNDRSRMKSNATMKNLSSPNGLTTTVIPPDADATRPCQYGQYGQYDLSAATTYYPGNSKKTALRILGNCLKHSLKDIARQPLPNSKVFEIVKTNNKAKYVERAARKGNEIDDRRRDRTVIRISPRPRPPATNEFWRYVMFPTRAPLTVHVASIAPAYRMRGLSGLKTGSRKRTKFNNDIYESFRRFYGVDKNKKWH